MKRSATSTSRDAVADIRRDLEPDRIVQRLAVTDRRADGPHQVSSTSPAPGNVEEVRARQLVKRWFPGRVSTFRSAFRPNGPHRSVALAQEEP